MDKEEKEDDAKSLLSSSLEMLGITYRQLCEFTKEEFGRWWRRGPARQHPDNFANCSVQIQKEQKEAFARLSKAKDVIESFLLKKSKSADAKDAEDELVRFARAQAVVQMHEEQVEETLVGEEQARLGKRKRDSSKEFGYVTLHVTFEQYKQHLMDAEKAEPFIVPIEFTTPCSTCDKTGYKPSKLVQCQYCNGAGIVFSTITTKETAEVKCPTCIGKKKVPRELEDYCSDCKGTAIVKRKYEHSVMLKPGLEDREVLGEAELKDGAEKVYEKIFIVVRLTDKL